MDKFNKYFLLKTIIYKLMIAIAIIVLCFKITILIFLPSLSINIFTDMLFDCLLIVLFLIIAIIINKINKNLYNKIKILADKDGLTGLYTRRVLDDKMNELIKNNINFSFAIFDIDDFKKINDNHGHLFGDNVLQHISNIIMNNIRKDDTCYRYGGEEICVIFEKIDKHTAYKICERIRNEIEQNNIITCNGQKINITISGGISEFNLDGKNKLEIIDNADDTLYLECKQKGKNKIAIYK